LISRSITEDKNIIKTINPTTEQILNQYEILSKEEISEIAKKAKEAFIQWKNDINKRIDFLHDFADELRRNKEHLAKTATSEMGKVTKESGSMEILSRNGFKADPIICRECLAISCSYLPIVIIS
jgi:acyl-CoA reductase-like NAD-dependent aldehyde dehydrogenase